MIGRAAMGNPWIFSSKATPETIIERMEGLSIHLEIISKFCDPDKILPKIRNQAGRYFKGIPGGSAIRRKIYESESFDELFDFTCSFQ
jgi:tRNA-dihydrouridine synthase